MQTAETPGPNPPQTARRLAKIEREVIARGIFTSIPDLARKTPSLHQRLLRQRSRDPVEIL
jgi:hypothetical protein